ncbi:NlpC/P60 family protein, partial [Nocardia sp. NPDC004718]
MRNNGGLTNRRRLSVAAGLLIAIAVVVTTGPVAAVPPPPPNPSDGEIAQAGAQVDAGVAEVGTLINQVAVVDQQLGQLDDAVAQRREDVNRALVDLQTARDAADAAAVVVVDTQLDLADAAAKVGQARRNFDQFATQAYTNPGSGSMVTYLAAATPAVAVANGRVEDYTVAGHDSIVLGVAGRDQHQRGH